MVGQKVVVEWVLHVAKGEEDGWMDGAKHVVSVYQYDQPTKLPFLYLCVCVCLSLYLCIVTRRITQTCSAGCCCWCCCLLYNPTPHCPPLPWLRNAKIMGKSPASQPLATCICVV
jgi:hypothetical protein